MTIHPEIIKTNKVITHLLEVPACLAEALHPTDWCRRRQTVCPWEDSRSPTEELEAEAADLQERPERCPSLPPGRSWLVALPSLIHCSLHALFCLILLRYFALLCFAELSIDKVVTFGIYLEKF